MDPNNIAMHNAWLIVSLASPGGTIEAWAVSAWAYTDGHHARLATQRIAGPR